MIHAVRQDRDGKKVYQVKLTSDRIESLPVVTDRTASRLTTASTSGLRLVRSVGSAARDLLAKAWMREVQAVIATV